MFQILEVTFMQHFFDNINCMRLEFKLVSRRNFKSHMRLLCGNSGYLPRSIDNQRYGLETLVNITRHL